MRHPVPIARDQKIHKPSIPNGCVLRLAAPPETPSAGRIWAGPCRCRASAPREANSIFQSARASTRVAGMSSAPAHRSVPGRATQRASSPASARTAARTCPRTGSSGTASTSTCPRPASAPSTSIFRRDPQGRAGRGRREPGMRYVEIPSHGGASARTCRPTSRLFRAHQGEARPRDSRRDDELGARQLIADDRVLLVFTPATPASAWTSRHRATPADSACVRRPHCRTEDMSVVSTGSRMAPGV